MDRSPDVPRCDYFVHWKWMNGLNSAEFKIVSPSVSKTWQGISFSDTSEKVYWSIMLMEHHIHLKRPYYFNEFEKPNILYYCSGIWTPKHQSILKSVDRRKTSDSRQWPSYWICNCWRSNSEIWWFWCDSRIPAACNIPQNESTEEK